MSTERHPDGSVKAIREKAGLTQEQLARLLGTSWTSVSRWERGLARPRADRRARLERLKALEERIGDALPKEEIPRFLQTAHPLLRGHRPMDLLQSDYAFQDLLAFIDAAKSGDMA